MFKNLMAFRFKAILVMGFVVHCSCATTLRIVNTPNKMPLHKDDLQLMQPHVVTIDYLERLLKKASEIFRPRTLQLMTEARFVQHQQYQEPIASHSQLQPVYASPPNQQIQPPTSEPFNFYMPQYDHDADDDVQLDTKSKHLAKFMPPPKQQSKYTNYYALKPKKIPKKFSSDTKQINLKWLNAFEREALTDDDGKVPAPFYKANDERNRINFNDSFFAVDTLVPVPNNGNSLTQTMPRNTGSTASINRVLGAAANEDEDLIATSSVRLPIFAFKQRSFSPI